MFRIFGPIVTLPNRLREWRIERIIGPKVERRMQELDGEVYGRKVDKVRVAL